MSVALACEDLMSLRFALIPASTLGNRAYSPDELSVAVGTTVLWTNTDSTAYTSPSDATEWNSGVVAPGAQYSFSFATAGRGATTARFTPTWSEPSWFAEVQRPHRRQ